MAEHEDQSLWRDLYRFMVPVVGAGVVVVLFGISGNLYFRFIAFVGIACAAVALFFIVRVVRSMIGHKRERR